MKLRSLTKREVKKALENDAWDLGNKVLYDLCLSHPHHKFRQEIIAKIWLIGRSYSAALERRKNKKKGSFGDLFYENKVFPVIKKQNIDSWLSNLDRNSTHEQIIQAHSKLTQIFRKITKLEKRSLASKYLHFHKRNLFFIYDSRAAKAIRRIKSDKKSQLPELTPNEKDGEYLKFFRRCLWLQAEIKDKMGMKLSPRDLDKLLLYISDRKLSGESFRLQNA